MPSDERLRAAVEHILGELRSPLDAGLRTFADGLDRDAAAARELAIREAAEAAAAGARRRADEEIEDIRRTAQSRLDDTERHAAARHDSRILLDAVRSLDEATAFGDVLGRLIQVRGGADTRLAVYVLRGERFHRWRAVGLPAIDSPTRVEPGVDDESILADAVRSGRAEVRGTSDPSSPSAGKTGGRVTMACPILVGGAVVAVLYADMLCHDVTGETRWRAVYEILARHAGRVLQAIAVQRTAGLLPHGGFVAAATGYGSRGNPR